MSSSIRSIPVYLTLDIGNTRTKFALFDLNGKVIHHGITENLEGLLQSFSHISSISYCSVTSKDINFEGFGGKVHELKSNSRLPITFDYQTPETLGNDRLAAAIGAVALFPAQKTLIVDAGTCLKLDLVDENAVFLGGSISPGLQMRYKALKTFTSKLSLVEDEHDVQWPGKSTGDSILAGVRLGFLAEVEARINEIENQNPGISVLLTGGDAPVLAERLKNRIFVEPLLIHYGLFHCLFLNEN